MMAGWLGTLVAAVAAIASTCEAAAQTADFGQLIGRFDKRCELSDGLDVLMNSVATYDEKRNHWVAAEPSLPNAVAGAVGNPAVKVETEYSEITLPVSGTWRGLPLVGFEFTRGHENGIGSFGLVFAASVADLRRVLGRDWTEKGVVVEPRNGAPYTYGLTREGGRVTAYCDVST